jgi:hypothetical protein
MGNHILWLVDNDKSSISSFMSMLFIDTITHLKPHPNYKTENKQTNIQTNKRTNIACRESLKNSISSAA